MKNVFLLSCASVAQGGGVYKYALTNQGTLEKQAYLPCDKPMYAVNDGKRLHILLRSPFSDGENSGYFSCKTDFTDVSTVQNTLGKCACHLAVDKDAYIVNYLSGNIVKNCKTSVTHSGKGVNLPRQDMPHTHFAAVTPDKKYVLCCDLGLDTIFIYDRDLNEISRAKVPDGYGVRHLVFSNDGRTVYAANELVPSVSVFSCREKTLEAKNTVPLPCETKNSTAAAIRLSRDGKTLYVSVRGENAVYALRAEGERLEIMQKIPCGGDSPRDFGVFGDTLICCNERSDNVSIWQLQNGLLHKQTCSLIMKAPLCVL